MEKPGALLAYRLSGLFASPSIIKIVIKDRDGWEQMVQEMELESALDAISERDDSEFRLLSLLSSEIHSESRLLLGAILERYSGRELPFDFVLVRERSTLPRRFIEDLVRGLPVEILPGASAGLVRSSSRRGGNSGLLVSCPGELV